MGNNNSKSDAKFLRKERKKLLAEVENFQKEGDSDILHDLYIQIAEISLQLGEKEVADDYQNRTLEIRAKMKDLIGLEGLNKDIYELIKKFSKMKRQLSFQEIFKLCGKELSASKIEIKEALDFLKKKRIIVETSRIYFKENVLKNEKRENVFALIQSNPGIHFTKILKTLNLSTHVAQWHIYMLKKFNFIREKKITRYSIFFSQESPPIWDLKYFTLRNLTTLTIFEEILNQPFITIKDLVKSIELHYSSIKYHLDKLEEADLIKCEKEDKILKYTINKKSKKFINQFFKNKEINEKKLTYL